MQKFVLGFLLVIVAVIGVFVGLPYALSFVRGGKGTTMFPKFFQVKPPSGFQRTTSRQNNVSLNQVGSKPVKILSPGVSIYQGKVVIRSVSTSRSRQQITLAAQHPESPVNITGWKVVNSRGYEGFIGKAVHLFGSGQASEPIYLGSGSKLTIFAGPNPVSDNFRINKCLGWLADYDFDPPVSVYCPTFSLEDFQALDGPCTNLLLRTPSCAQPRADILNQYSNACRLFVEKKYNYSYCVEEHHNDANFYSDFRVYTGSNIFLFDSFHDELELRDQAGFLVDSYSF